MLQELMKGIPVKRVEGGLGARPNVQDVRGLTQDSRRVEKGFLFVAIAGESQDGHDFVADAVKKGAAAVVASRRTGAETDVPQFIVKDSRAALADLAARFYGEPSLKMRVAGVTGTNGKTSVTYILESILKAAGRKPAVLGTVNYRYAGKVLESLHTTPESVDLQKLFSEMLAADVTDVVMEVSSHALDMERVRGVHFDAAGFTNLTQDHLDYHADLADYFEAKKKLFSRFLKDSRKDKRTAVLNFDDASGRLLARKSSKASARSIGRLTVSVDGPADLFCSAYALGEGGVEAELASRMGAFSVRSPLIGLHNLQNILVAVGLALAMDVKPESIVKGVADFKCVPGRLERIENGRGIHAFVDYAHTPDAVGRVAATLRDFAKKTGGRLITVFGCGGDRDRAKRPLMGLEAGRHSDVVIVTSDNPRTEDPEAIIDGIMPGLEEAKLPKERIHRVTSREAALKKAVSLAKPGDFLLVAGKGHEDYQIVGKTKSHFSDQEILRGLLGS